ncbi:hypothetical protein Godav_029302 [Gossypium davidsonii]|uniref:RNase H type-1 domain-containing protein n=2 Tax=Gossypium TaxID=3633 RepID=A0A7J8TKC5_GOSDV|nr:hypothetical protein [Gossypium davidsonii]MBA0650018.1 hypothetical protein [Gossypium klotzschianum]
MQCEGRNTHPSLKDCPTVQAILALGGLDNRLLVRDYSYCIDWIEDIMCVGYESEDEARVVWDRAKTLCQDFRIHNLVNKLVLPITHYETLMVSFLVGGGGFKDEELTAEWAELYAFEESLRIACSINISKVIFETDCASLVNRVKKRGK